MKFIVNYCNQIWRRDNFCEEIEETELTKYVLEFATRLAKKKDENNDWYLEIIPARFRS